jgi:hypothetical protein
MKWGLPPLRGTSLPLIVRYLIDQNTLMPEARLDRNQI